METIINYFETIPTIHRTLLLVGGIAFFWILESIDPLFDFKYNKIRHALPNIFFTLTTALINLSLAFALVKSSDWVVEHKFGIMQWLPAMPLWLFALLGLMLLDLIGAYFIHWLEHKVKWMWMFHIIHHSDRQIDTTTANRHHPGESVFRFVFTTLAVIITGAPMWLVFMYQSFSVILSQFNHANIGLPLWLDKALSYVLITPDMHHVHHHYVLPYSDTNYGNIFSIWDRIFGTFSTLDREKLIYGIDTVMDTAENEHIKPMLKIPFAGYRQPTG